MNFAAEHTGTGQPLSRIALVSALHVLALGLLIQGGRQHFSPAVAPALFKPVPAEPPKPLEPTPPPKPVTKTEAPKVTIPPPVVDVEPTRQKEEIVAERSERKMPPAQPSHEGKRDEPAAVLPPDPVAAPVRVAAVVDARNCSKPEYPPRAYRNHQSGTVTLQMLIGVDGRVVDAKVEKSSGYRELDLAAREGLSLCKFKPGTLDGVPQQSWTKIAYVWEIAD